MHAKTMEGLMGASANVDLLTKKQKPEGIRPLWSGH